MTVIIKKKQKIFIPRSVAIPASRITVLDDAITTKYGDSVSFSKYVKRLIEKDLSIRLIDA